MTIIMTKDGNVRPMQLSDLKEVAKRDERIRQLEKLNATLSAEIDASRPVVEAARNVSEHGCGQCMADLDEALAAYEAARPRQRPRC